MKKFTLLVSFLAVMSFGFSSNVVPVGDAVKVSKNFLSERIGSMKAQSFDITLAYTEYDQNGTPVYYRFQVGEKGFIIKSMEKDLSVRMRSTALEAPHDGVPSK